MRVNIKPLSINNAWRGKRFKTPEYITYEKHALSLLKKTIIPDGDLYLKLEFGFSSKRCDIDNPVKLWIDILQKKYLFNDSRIYKLDVTKIIVAKRDEYIDFEVYEYKKGVAQNER